MAVGLSGGDDSEGAGHGISWGEIRSGDCVGL
jgi:hypothetical protein